MDPRRYTSTIHKHENEINFLENYMRKIKLKKKATFYISSFLLKVIQIEKV